MFHVMWGRLAARGGLVTRLGRRLPGYPPGRAQLDKPMPLVFCPAISAGSVGRSSRSTESPVFAWSLASISVPRFLQVSGRGKNERHWLDKLPHNGTHSRGHSTSLYGLTRRRPGKLPESLSAAAVGARFAPAHPPP